MTTNLLEMDCAPTPATAAPLKGAALDEWLVQVPGWSVVEEHHLRKTYPFPDFVTALAFVNRVGMIAEREQHHPDILLSWGKVEVTTFTHSIQGLSRNDFILAAKIDAEATAEGAPAPGSKISR
jgi:4a-hydroxytetrahydrobiopterin dehydratase